MEIPGIWRRLLLTGVLGPVLFSVTVLVAGALRPGYSHADQFISELGESGGRLAWLMNIPGFMLSAALMLVFILVFRSRFEKSATRTTGTFLLAMFAGSVFVAGVFSCDAGCLPDDPSPTQRMHDLVSIIAFPAFTLGVFAWGASFCRMREWRGFGIYSLVSAALSVVFLALMVQSEATRDGTGTFQRLFLGTLFLWMVLLSIQLWRSSTDDATEPAS